MCMCFRRIKNLYTIRLFESTFIICSVVVNAFDIKYYIAIIFRNTQPLALGYSCYKHVVVSRVDCCALG